MQLRRVKIFGFKTFADRAEFDFEGGLVAIVGANGVGKSNLVDAVLWGLGEGNARQLRAQTGQDVIFNGSSKRKPLGYAEVQLTFDNEDGTLPVQASEVTITRRLTRGGDSEYRLNRVVCRQRDIYELLADSGLGRSGYSIVGQRDIDSALSASPEERRGWVDEAAGVQRYRQRRSEAQKRLTLARDHLQRTIDILKELEAQREPLREDAEIAIRYRELQTTFQSLDQAILTRDFRQIKDLLSEIEIEFTKTREQSESHAQKHANLDIELDKLVADIQAAEKDLERKSRVIQEERSQRESIFSEQRLEAQKLDSLKELEEDLNSDSETMVKRIAEAQSELKAAASELEWEDNELNRLTQSGNGFESERKLISARLRDVESQIQKAQDFERERMKVEAENKHRLERKKEIKRELDGISLTEPDLLDGVEAAEQSHKSAQDLLLATRTEVKGCEERIKQIAAEERTRDEEYRKLLGAKASTKARAEAVASTLESAEGVSQGAKAILEANKKGKLQGEFTPVGLALRAHHELALAIEVALGGAASDLIVPDEGSAKQGVAFLKEHQSGRATFQPLSLLRNQTPSPEFRHFLSEHGVVGRAADLVEVEEKFKPVAESLLGRIVIVKTLEDAIKLSKGKSRPYNRMVTIDGEVIHSSGSVTGGTSYRQSSGLVQRVAELQSLHDELKQIDEKISGHEKHAESLKKDRVNILSELDSLHQQIGEYEVNERDAKAYWTALINETQANERSKARLISEFEKLNPLDLPDFEGPPLENLEVDRNQILVQLASLNSEVEQFSSRFSEVQERAKKAKVRFEAADRRLQSANESNENRLKRINKIGPERVRLNESIGSLQVQIELKIKVLETEEKEIENGRLHKLELTEQFQALSQQKQAELEVQNNLSNSIHKLEIDRLRLQSKLANVQERLAEDYAVFEEGDQNLFAKFEIPIDAESILSRLKREMKAMGNVNLGAIVAYERLTERYTDLEGQQSDISKGIEDVEASIRELDLKTKDQFTHALNQIQVHFSNLFRRLFEGGEGHLVLTDSKDVLNSGLELDVTLPGKKNQPLALLSGGERSLCALAFLFALLEVKQSPLVVLDEVDAPLDGRNVGSFVQLLKDYSKVMQFIVITHNPTTISAAPIWLGITMQDPGCSMLVPYRSSDKVSENDKEVVLA